MTGIISSVKGMSVSLAKLAAVTVLVGAATAALFLYTGILAVASTATPSEAAGAYALAVNFCLAFAVVYVTCVYRLVYIVETVGYGRLGPPTDFDDTVEFVGNLLLWFTLWFGPFFLTWGGALMLQQFAGQLGAPYASLLVTNGASAIDCGVLVGPGLSYWIPVSLALGIGSAALVMTTEDWDRIKRDKLERARARARARS